MNATPDPRRVPVERPKTAEELRKEQMDRAIDDELARMASKWDYERY
ncbi:hypothetical protein [Sphingomonas sp.]